MSAWPPPLPPVALRAGFVALAAPRTLRFAAALRAPEAAQDRVLRRIVGLTAGSRYGRHLGLDPRDGYAAFRRKVPLVDYDDLRPWIDEQVATGAPVLSREPALLYERTSGSSGRPKLVPYPPALLAAFNACFVVWAADLVAAGPRFRTGRIFFSVSPAFQKRETTPTGVPISLADDAAYLSPRMQRLFGGCFFVPPALKHIREGAAYRRALAATLIAEARLEVLSVWSPTYLLSLLDAIHADRDALLADLRRGRTGPADVPIALPRVAPERLRLLERDPVPWTALWPALQLVSCWTDGASAVFVPALRRSFPGVLLQGKGLLATEAPVTVPLLRASAPVPLLDEVFLELEDEGGAPRRLHELKDGHEYTVVVTQPGGLLRYRMHDRVRAEGRVGRTAGLRFLGRDGRTSDLAGEKLGEPFVRAALAATLGAGVPCAGDSCAGDSCAGDSCAYLVAEAPPGGVPGYTCVTDAPAGAGDPVALADRLDGALRAAFHYAQARDLGQLRAPRVVWRADARAHYERMHLERGFGWGNIKFEALVPLRDAT